MPNRRLATLGLFLALVGAVACGGSNDLDRAAPADTTASTTTVTTEPPPTTTTIDPRFARPDWLGQRPLPLRPDGHGQVQPTPPELVDRQLATVDHLPRPEGDEFEATIDPVPQEVVARSTWNPDCPVTLDELRYVTVTFWGFDGIHHRGELIVNASAAEGIVNVFRGLHLVRFPLEEMRVVDAAELDAPPTGDVNNTTSFVCRPSTGGSGWSEHAFGLAIDVNEFHNPYVKDDLVLPELASAYTDRGRQLPGMIHADDPVVRAFADMGWEWGGYWNSLKDYQHFSHNGQ